MVNEIELFVCDKCNTVMYAAGEVYTCLKCNKPMFRAKFTRQPTKRAADGGKPRLFIDNPATKRDQ